MEDSVTLAMLFRIICGVLILCLVLLHCLRYIAQKLNKQSNFKTTTTQNAFYKKAVSVLPKRVNCNNQLNKPVYSVSDEWCSDICQGPTLFKAANGVCINSSLLLKGALTDNTPNGCALENGELPFVTGDPMFGVSRIQCLSADPGVVIINYSLNHQAEPNKYEKSIKNVLCGNGVLKSAVDYMKGIPDASSSVCQCENKDFVLAIVPATSTIRQRAWCASKDALPALQYLNLLLE